MSLTSNGPPSTTSSPRASTMFKIPLDDFCTHYSISDTNQAKLLESKCKPENTVVESLEE
jgi:hypothetical protein